MEQQISRLVIRETEKFMDKSQHELAISDEIYQNDCRDQKELEVRYEALNLTGEQRMLINDNIACIKSADSRYAELSYMAGILDTVKVLACWGLLKSPAAAAVQK